MLLIITEEMINGVQDFIGNLYIYSSLVFLNFGLETLNVV